MKSKRVHIILATSLFALLLWFSVSMSYEYQTTLSVPLFIQSLPEGKAIRTPLPESVQLRFRGDGWRLATLLLRSEFRLTLDLRAFHPNQQGVALSDVIERLDLPVGLQPVGMKPDSLRIVLDTYTEKRLAVKPDFTISFREGYAQVGPTVLLPESVTVGGAATLLKTMSSWKTQRQVFDNRRSSITVNVPLSDSLSQILRFDPPNVSLRINIQQFAEKAFRGLDVEVVSIPSNLEVILSPPRIDVIVRGGIEQLANTQVENIRPRLEFEKILADTTGRLQPEVTIPPGVQIVTREPEFVQYIVRKRL